MNCKTGKPGRKRIGSFTPMIPWETGFMSVRLQPPIPLLWVFQQPAIIQEVPAIFKVRVFHLIMVHESQGLHQGAIMFSPMYICTYCTSCANTFNDLQDQIGSPALWQREQAVILCDSLFLRSNKSASRCVHHHT